jgi:hypothetical protein
MFDPNRPAGPSRFEVVRLALQEIGNPGHMRIMEYHRNAIGRAVGDRELEWCGLFCLAMLHDAGIAEKVLWHIGGGFCEEQRLAKVKLPEPGDIAYYDKPYRHHALVHSVDTDAGTFSSIDGNQAADTVVLRTRIPLTKPTCFYSIAALLRQALDTEPAPPPEPEAA